PGTLQELISQTMVHWAQESFIQSPALVRAMFSLLHGQYDALGELGRALPKAYAISATSVPDTTALLECLGQIRSLLIVQMGPEEENLMIQSIGCVGRGCRDPGAPCPSCDLLLSLFCPPVSPLCPPCVPLYPFCSPCVLLSPCVPPVSSPCPPCVHLCPAVSFLCPRSPVSPPVFPGVPQCPPMSPMSPMSPGYPDIGWNPCGGEKYLDFLRFAVFVNGE
ncbi:RYR1 protein, partial [Sterrhoptilus dennistouni]|nr:RYR1 protein [Sterrhoptilus dennistouni]